MGIRIYVQRLEKFLQQRFKQLNLSLYANRRSNYVHIGMDIPLLMTNVSSELVAAIENFEKEKGDPGLIHTTRWKYDYIIFERKNTL